MPPEHRDAGGSCSVPPDEIFTFSAETSSKSPVEPTVVRPGLCVATGMKLRRRREVWCGVTTGIDGLKQRTLKMKIRRLVLFSLWEQGPRVDDGTNALIFETIPCEVCEPGQSPCERASPCETEWFRINAKKSPHLVRVQNPSRACRCPLCVVGLVTFQYHLQFSGVSSTLVPCSHPWGEDVKERLTKCSHWSGADKDLFQSHATAALEGEMRMDWSCSAQEYRCCLGLVIQKVVKDGASCRASQFWLMMWAAFALISLYNLRLRDLEQYLEVSDVVSDVLECHLRASLSYFTKGRKTCAKRRAEVKGVLRKTLADLRADSNRVHFEHGLTKKATKSGISEVELIGQLCEQHARAGNYEDFFHWKKKLKELAGDNWMEYIEGATYGQLLMDIGDDFRAERYICRDKAVSYMYPEVAGLAFDELDSRLKDAQALYQQGEVRKAFECVMELKQKLEVFRSRTTDRSVFIAVWACQVKLVMWVVYEEQKLGVHGGSHSWLEEFYQEQRSLLEAGYVDHCKEYFIIEWALGYRSNYVTWYHYIIFVLFDRKTAKIFEAIQQLHIDWCAHEWNAHTIAFHTTDVSTLFSDFAEAWLQAMHHMKTVAFLKGQTLFSLRDMHNKLRPKSQFFKSIAAISRGFQCLIHYQQQVKDMMLKCCRGIILEPNQVSLREVLEYGNAASSMAGISSSQEAFLWGERTLQSSLLYQLPRNRLCADSQKELQKFFHDDVFAWEVLKEAQELCGPGARCSQGDLCGIGST